MSIISLIAAIDENGGIGLKNQLLCYLPADLQYFKATTLGKPIIMGKHTFDSIGKPLPGRLNVVLSRTSGPIEGVTVHNSLDEAIEETKGCAEVMIIGGAQLYNQTIEIAHRLYITRIHHQFEADVYFPEINSKIWTCRNAELRPADEKNKYDLSFCIYEKN